MLPLESVLFFTCGLFWGVNLTARILTSNRRGSLKNTKNRYILGMYEKPNLIPRLISQAFIACSMKSAAFYTASDKSLGDKPGNEAMKSLGTRL